jgi:hypothetical protein
LVFPDNTRPPKGSAVSVTLYTRDPATVRHISVSDDETYQDPYVNGRERPHTLTSHLTIEGSVVANTMLTVEISGAPLAADSQDWTRTPYVKTEGYNYFWTYPPTQDWLPKKVKGFDFNTDLMLVGSVAVQRSGSYVRITGASIYPSQAAEGSRVQESERPPGTDARYYAAADARYFPAVRSSTVSVLSFVSNLPLSPIESSPGFFIGPNGYSWANGDWDYYLARDTSQQDDDSYHLFAAGILLGIATALAIPAIQDLLARTARPHGQSRKAEVVVAQPGEPGSSGNPEV